MMNGLFPISSRCLKRTSLLCDDDKSIILTLGNEQPKMVDIWKSFDSSTFGSLMVIHRMRPMRFASVFYHSNAR